MRVSTFAKSLHLFSHSLERRITKVQPSSHPFSYSLESPCDFELSYFAPSHLIPYYLHVRLATTSLSMAQPRVCDVIEWLRKRSQTQHRYAVLCVSLWVS